MIAGFRNHVCEGDLRRHETIDGELADFRIDKIHAVYFWLCVNDRAVDTQKKIAGRGIGFADKEEIGPRHVSDYGAESNELGTVT